MPSIVSDFAYDIFISYRHNDNRSGWVTEFVRALQEELAATIKDPISIYVDYNLHDGLRETHIVDKSLAEKLKCLIFIPIISQTYCDPKSFAWKNEFCAFNKVAQGDRFGRDIKLKNGNVASRILPVQIHELDSDDRGRLNDEMGGIIRSVEFIYQTTGVLRPLLPNEEDPKGNLNHTFYRDQMNKVVRGVKELISGMVPTRSADPPTMAQRGNVPRPIRKKLSILAGLLIAIGLITFSLFYFAGFGNKLFQTQDKSIAVLPFENMNNDPAQDYFSNGITEDILNHLVKIADLKVKSRTSTLQYKGTIKTVTQIGDELGVGNVVEGSVRQVGDKVRIVVQLIDAKSDVHLWSETYDRDFKDILALQSEIAVEIAKALEAKLTSAENQNIKKEITGDVTAYDYFLKAREIVNRYGNARNKADLSSAISLVDHAIQFDNNFSQAFALKGKIWSLMRLIGVSEKTWTDSSIYYSSKAIELDVHNPSGYLVKAEVLSFVGNLKESAALIRMVYQLAPNNTEVQNNYGNLLLADRNEKGAELVINSIEGQYQIVDPQYYSQLSFVFFFMNDFKGAEDMLLKALSLDPGSGDIILFLSWIYRDTQEYAKAIEVLNQSKVRSVAIIDAIAEMYTMKKDYSSAIKYYEQYKEIEKAFEDTTQSVPLRHRLAFAYSEIGRKKEGDKLMLEQLQILNDMIAKKRSMGTWIVGVASIYYDRALCLAYFGKKNEAVNSLDSAFHYGWASDWYYHNDPLLANLQADDGFQAFLKKIDAFTDFRKEAFTRAFNRAKARKELKGLLVK